MPDKVIHSIADALGNRVDQLSEDASAANTTEWDSVGNLNVLEAMERAFGIQVSLEDSLGLTSVAAWRAYLAERGVSSE